VNSFEELKMLIFPVREYERKIELQHKRIKRSTRPPKRSMGVCEGAGPLFPFPILLFIHIFFIDQMEHAPEYHEDEHERRKHDS
jgi:hypothetical protein